MRSRKPTPYQRKLRRFKHLSKKVNRLLASGELQRWSESSRNKLLRTLEGLYRSLRRAFAPHALKRILAAAAGLIGLQMSSGLHAQQGPEGMVGYFPSSATYTVGFDIGDLDQDGDMDLFTSRGFYGEHYFENTGSATTPSFVNAPAVDTFEAFPYYPNFADIDDDGDLDLFASFYPGSVWYRYAPTFFEDTAGSNEPIFATRVDTPFNVNAAVGSYKPDVYQHGFTFGDVDNDGDLDFFTTHQPNSYTNNEGLVAFFENGGDAQNPDFSQSVVLDPFGLNDTLSGPSAYRSMDLGDVDGDGDLDIMVFEGYAYYWGPSVLLFENVGSPSNPQFGTAQADPFGFKIPETYTYYSQIDLADIDDDGDADVFLSMKGGYFGYAGSDTTVVLYYENNGIQTGTRNHAKGSDAPGLTIHPDPVLDASPLVFTYRAGRQEELRAILYDENGRKIREEALEAGKGTERWSLEGQERGVYILELRSSDGRMTERFVKE